MFDGDEQDYAEFRGVDFSAITTTDKTVRCWYCSACMRLKQRSENDGDCIYCGVEIDLTEEPYTKKTV